MNCLKSECGVDIGVEAVDVYCKEIGMVGDDHGSDGVYEMVCILYVAGVFCGEGAKEVVYVLGDIVGGAVTIRDDGSAGGDFVGYCPGYRIFVDLGE